MPRLASARAPPPLGLYQILFHFKQTFPSVSFHRCRCVSVNCVERVLSVLDEKDSEAVLGAWLPAPTDAASAACSERALAVGVEKDLGGIDV